MEVFVYPCNVNFLDVDKFFSDHDTIVWRKCGNMQVSDIVYIYVGKPHLAVTHKCEVVKTQIDEETLMANSYAIPKGKIANRVSYIQMKLVKKFDDSIYPLSELRENGMGQFMVPMKASDRLKAYLVSKDKEWMEV